MSKWPRQDKPLYRYRLEPDGSVTYVKIKEYGIVRYRQNREEYWFTCGSICSVRVQDIGRVKHNHITMFEEDMEKTKELFKEHLQNKCAAAEKTAADCRELLKRMER